MPNFDGGHYFLTVLAPVMVGASAGADSFSHRQRLLEALARMPTAEVTTSSRGEGGNSPFARNTATHLARFVLIDGPAFNGRLSGDTLIGKLAGVDPLAQQEADRLSTPFLLFAADFDAADGSDAELRRYTDTLWSTMQPELREVFGFCYGFEAVTSAERFFDYVKRCQVETTMPFNDYWPEGAVEKLSEMPVPIGKIRAGALAAGGIVAAWLASLLLGAVLPDGPLREWAAFVARWGLLVVPLMLAAAALYLYSLYRRVMARGREPFPEGAKLPEVLKALYLQQQFARFAIDTQGKSDADLHAAFGAFLARHRPGDLAGPTQPPGVISLHGRLAP